MFSSDVGDIVFDPFLGSGTVAVVSKMLKRHYLGFEIVPEYYEFAKKRIESVQMVLFDGRQVVRNKEND